MGYSRFNPRRSREIQVRSDRDGVDLDARWRQRRRRSHRCRVSRNRWALGRNDELVDRVGDLEVWELNAIFQSSDHDLDRMGFKSD